MKVQLVLAAIVAALAPGARAGGLRATPSAVVDSLAASGAALSSARAVVEAQARVLAAGGAASTTGIKEALDAINTSIDIFNKISDIVIDKSAVNAATKYVSDKQAEMIKYGDTTTTQSLQLLALCGVEQSQTAQRIKTMALTLSKNAANTKLLFGRVTVTDGTLDAGARKMLSASLTLLSSSLSTAVTQTSDALAAFERLEGTAASLTATLTAASLHFLAEQNAASSTMTQAMNSVREQAYGTCGAVCVITVALGCPPCFAAAVPIVEAKIIPDLKAKLASFSAMMSGFQDAFATFGTVAQGYASTAKNSVAALGEYVAVVSSADSFVSATSDVDVAIILVDVYHAQLDEIANATARLINKIPADA
jgi:hypothetical protein